MAYKKVEQYDEQTTEAIAGHVEEILKLLGEDSRREGLVNTPTRVAKALQFLTQGYWQSGEEVASSALFCETGADMVFVRDIDLFSMCEHHLMPFIGKAHVAYIPNGKIVGISKIARVVEVYARRFQVQERLGAEICECLQKTLGAKGVAVRIEAQHTCMTMRGVQKANSNTVTTCFSGTFEDDANLRAEFLNNLI